MNKKPIDWTLVRAQLRQAEARLAAVLSPDERQRERVLAERAAELRSRPRQASAKAAASLLVFRVGGDRYAVPLGAVAEISRIGTLTPAPGAPEDLHGIISVRGELVSVVAVASSTDPQFRPEWAIALRHPQLRLSIGTTSIEGIATIAAEELESLAPGAQFRLRGEMAVLLDAEAILRKSALHSATL